MKAIFLSIGFLFFCAPLHASEKPILRRVGERLFIPCHDVSLYFSDSLILKAPLGNLREWSSKFGIHEGDSDKASNVEIKFVRVVEKKSGKIIWSASGKIVDGIAERKTITPFKNVTVMVLDEDGSAFFKIGKLRCYLFRHKTAGCILVVEDGFYTRLNQNWRPHDPKN